MGLKLKSVFKKQILKCFFKNCSYAIATHKGIQKIVLMGTKIWLKQFNLIFFLILKISLKNLKLFCAFCFNVTDYIPRCKAEKVYNWKCVVQLAIWDITQLKTTFIYLLQNSTYLLE